MRYIEYGVGRIWRQLAVGDSVANDLPRGRLSLLNRILLR